MDSLNAREAASILERSLPHAETIRIFTIAV